jgi:hypothetical protein
MIDLKELFSKTLDIKVNYLGTDLIHHLREPSPEEDLQYRRRCSDVRVSGRDIHSTATALTAGIWLYDQICERVSASDADGLQEVPEFKTKIPNDLKTAVINAYLNRFEIVRKEPPCN